MDAAFKRQALIEKRKDITKDSVPTDDERITILTGKNYSLVTRHGRKVKVEEEESEQEIRDSSEWDNFEERDSSNVQLLYAGADTHMHILTDFYVIDGLQPKRRKMVHSEEDECASSVENGVETSDGETVQSGSELKSRLKRSCSDTGNVNFTEQQVNGTAHNDSDLENANSDKTPCRNSVCTFDRSSVDKSKCQKPERKRRKSASNCLTVENANHAEKPLPIKASENGIHDEEDEMVFKRKLYGNKHILNNIKVEPVDVSDHECSKETNSETRDNCEQTEMDTEPLTCSTLKCKSEEVEDESYRPDEPSLVTMTDGREHLARRCICISNIFRSLSFVPGNDLEMSKNPGLLYVIGQLLLLHHRHEPRKPKQQFDGGDDDERWVQYCSSLEGEQEWFWECLDALRENALVVLTNVAGRLHLMWHPEEIVMPVLDGLLHWGVCPSSYAHDPMPTMSQNSVLSPQRLALEALSKLSIQEHNVDLLLATPPFDRLDEFFSLLASNLVRTKEQPLREMSVVLLSNLVQGDSSATRAIACQQSMIPNLLSFLEEFEVNALQIANTHGINMLRDNPEIMGTSLDMLRRTANSLVCLARVDNNKPLFIKFQQRLLHLVMSQILDQQVALLISDVLYEITHILPSSSSSSS